MIWSVTTTNVDPYNIATMELINNQRSNIKGIILETQHNTMATKIYIFDLPIGRILYFSITI